MRVCTAEPLIRDCSYAGMRDGFFCFFLFCFLLLLINVYELLLSASF